MLFFGTFLPVITKFWFRQREWTQGYHFIEFRHFPNIYMKIKDGVRGIKSLREVYEETRLRLGCHIFVSDNRWIKEVWKQEARKGCNSIKDKIILTMQTKCKRIQSEGEDVKLKGKILDRKFKPIWKQVKKCFKKGSLENRLEQYIKCKGNAK